MFDIYVKTSSGDIVKAFSWSREEVAGVVKGRADAVKFGYDVIAVWAVPSGEEPGKGYTVVESSSRDGLSSVKVELPSGVTASASAMFVEHAEYLAYKTAKAKKWSPPAPVFSFSEGMTERLLESLCDGY